MLIETENQYNRFHSKFKTDDCVVIPIFSDTNLHPQENILSLLYISFIDGKDYILPFNHSEANNLESTVLTELDTECNIYTSNKQNTRAVEIEVV